MQAKPDAGLVVTGVRKRFGHVAVLDHVGFAAARGEFVTLLGPSGCGKTTLLRIVAGLERADAGRVTVDGRDLTGEPPHRRPVNTVFQSYALFPHLSVADNVAFGLRARRAAEGDVRRRVADALALLRIDELRARRPDELSGGQKQRVAVARALVNEPAVLLLDEPMSALDAQLRGDLQLELRRLQRRLGTTFVLVTHDQEEAMTVSDRIIVMDRGRIAQSGVPRAVYERPATRFVAAFLGAANLVAARRVDDHAVETVLGPLRVASAVTRDAPTIAIRPERIVVHAERPAANAVRATVREALFKGDHGQLFCDPGDLRVRIAARDDLAAGAQVWLELPAEHLQVLDD
ncbi:MAG TPA: ABC transporter ATP-binding protein [Planctomycetota bacterium]|nr:ABC transporter ATP-binding protein [Planctomycetota bacterium]